MTYGTFGSAAPHRRTDQHGGRAFDVSVEPSREAVLGVLDDADCREMLAELDDPKSASDLVERCDIPSSTVYRKLERLTEAGLATERTALREGFQQVTVYVRTFDSVRVVATDDGLAVEVEEREGTPEGRLSRLWTALSDET